MLGEVSSGSASTKQEFVKSEWAKAAAKLSSENYTRLAQLCNKSMVSFCQVGDPEGVPMLFIHGLIGNRFEMALYDDMAKDRGIYLICIDRPGRGLSSPAKSLKAWDYLSWTSIFAEMLDILKIGKFMLMAYCVGCPYAISITQVLFDRIIGPVRFVAPWLPTNYPCMPKSYSLTRSLPTKIVRTYKSIFSFHASMFPGSPAQTGYVGPREQAWLSLPLMQEVLYRIADDNLGSGYPAYEVDWLLAIENIKPMNVSYKDVPIDIKIWHGMDDKLVPLGAVMWLQKEIPGLVLNVVRDSSHNIALDLDAMNMIFDDVKLDIIRIKNLQRDQGQNLLNGSLKFDNESEKTNLQVSDDDEIINNIEFDETSQDLETVELVSMNVQR